MWREQAFKKEAKGFFDKFSPYALWAAVILLFARSCASGGESAHEDTSASEAAKAYGGPAIIAYLTATQGDKGAAQAVYGSLVADRGADKTCRSGQEPSGGQRTCKSDPFPFPGKTVKAWEAKEPVRDSSGPETWLVTDIVLTGAGIETWQLRIAHAAGGYTPASLPGLVPSAGPASGVGTKAAQAVAAQSPLGQAVNDFFKAWLTNSKDLPRLAGSDVPRFQNPTITDPSNVKVVSMFAETLPQQASGSAVVSVVVDATTTTTTRMGYTVKMGAEGGLWKAASVTASPPLTSTGPK